MSTIPRDVMSIARKCTTDGEIAAAILAERERCARIADDYDQAPGDDTTMGPIMAAQLAIAYEIADRIRNPEGGAA